MNNTEKLRQLRNIERAKLKNKKYVQKEEKQKQNALHSTRNHRIGNYGKTNFQQVVLNELRPMTYTNKRTKKLVYKRAETMNRMYAILSHILAYGTPREVREILQLREFVRNSAIVRNKRNRSKRLYNDPQKQGHNIARQFAYNRLQVFNHLFPETLELLF